MKFPIITLAVIFFLVIPVVSQNIVKPLNKVNIGDQVPEYWLNNLINSPQSKININNFNGKIVILDFWHSTCSSCLKSWPELMALQSKYKDELQIILVNPTEGLEKINAVIKSQEKIHGYKMVLSIAYADDVIKKLFPHILVPHIVYIDSFGILKFITTNVSDQLIQAIINQKKIVLQEKIDDYADITWSKPLFINGNNAKDDVGQNVIYSSIITPYSPNIFPTSNFVDSEHSKLTGRTLGVIANFSIIEMFRQLYGRDWMKWHWVFPVPKARIVFRDVDTTRLVRIVDGVPNSQNLYTIQVTARNDIPIEKVRKKMISDLEDNFALRTRWEKQKKLCYVVTRTTAPLTVYKEGLDSLLIGGQALNFNNISMKDFLDRLIYYTPSLKRHPVVDETNFQGVLGKIKLDASKVENDNILGKELLKHGLKISIEERDAEILVIGSDEAAGQKKQ